MDEVLTIAEIHSRFDREWVLLENPRTDPDMNVIGGKLLFHSKDRDEVDRKALELRPRHSAFVYTGAMPEDAAIIL